MNIEVLIWIANILLAVFIWKLIFGGSIAVGYRNKTGFYLNVYLNSPIQSIIDFRKNHKIRKELQSEFDKAIKENRLEDARGINELFDIIE